MSDKLQPERMPLYQNIKEVSTGKLTSVEKNILAIRKDLKALKPHSPSNPFDLTAWESQCEVYDTLMEAVDTINSKTITCRGTMIADVVDGVVVVGFAMCNTNYYDWNKENRDVLREIAMARAITWKNRTLAEVEANIPESVYMDVYLFCQRAFNYYKDTKVSPWVAEMLGFPAFASQVENVQIQMENQLEQYAANLENDMVLTLNTIFKDLFGFDLKMMEVENEGC
jgi:hypothetical protein